MMNRIYTVNMPDIGEGVVEGEVVAWLKQNGDWVKQDEPIVVVMTDKATVELPAPYPGKLVKQYQQAGQIAIKDHPLYDLELSEESVVPVIKTTAPPTSSQTGKKLAIPAARRLAHDLGVDLERVIGTGPEGRVTVDDIKHFQKPLPAKTGGDEMIQLKGIQGLMSKKMAQAKREIPHFSYFEQADASRLVQLQSHVSQEAVHEHIQVTFMPFLIRALSLTIREFPLINSSLDGDKQNIVIHKAQHIGIAMSTSQGLIVPVLKDVQNLTYVELIKAYEALKQKAREEKLSPEEMRGSTITLSNFGVLGGGGLWATPIINYPEAAILAVAKIHKQPLVKNDTIVIRDVLNLSWSFDHRFIDGHLAALCSHHFSSLIQNPAALL